MLAVFSMMNYAYASSGKISFKGVIVRDVCAVNSLEMPFDVSIQSQKIAFNFTFSGCVVSPEDVKVNFYDVSSRKEPKISSNVMFNLVENKEKIIEIDGKRNYLPMQLSGHYVHHYSNQPSAKLINVEYH